MPIQLQKPEYLVVYVSDMQRSVAFYRDVLGLPLRFTSPGWSEFDTGSIALALHVTGPAQENGPAYQGRPPAGMAHLGFVVDDLPAIYEALKARDVHFSLPPQKQPTGRTLAVLHDPDGFGLTLQQRES